MKYNKRIFLLLAIIFVLVTFVAAQDPAPKAGDAPKEPPVAKAAPAPAGGAPKDGAPKDGATPSSPATPGAGKGAGTSPSAGGAPSASAKASAGNKLSSEVGFSLVAVFLGALFA